MHQRKHEDFLEMKQLLIKYIETEKEKELVIKTDIDYSPLRKYGTIINFNYCHTYFMNPNLRFRQSRIDPSEIDEIHIHGSFKDGKNIVSGFDDGMALNRQSKEYELISVNSKKYSKTHQLLTLATSRNDIEIYNQKLPLKERIHNLGILGHSIGQLITTILKLYVISIWLN